MRPTFSPKTFDGIGGGQATTSKVAILSPSEHAGVDVDYLFAQVHAEKAEVDFSPSCGNILAGVGPAALELGLVPARGELTCIHIRNVNTDALIDASVQTPGGQIEYDGDAGTELTCIDVAMPMVIGRARDFGITGHEPRDVLDADVRLFQRIEKLRLEAGTLMGFGDVSDSVIPKFGLLSEPASGGSVCARYCWCPACRCCTPAYPVDAWRLVCLCHRNRSRAQYRHAPECDRALDARGNWRVSRSFGGSES